MRKNQLLSVLSLFLLVPASITRAQTVNLTGTVSMEQDYRIVNFISKLILAILIKAVTFILSNRPYTKNIVWQ